MQSTRVTNSLLFVIAICLIAIASRQLGVIGVVNAQQPKPPIVLVDVVGWEVGKNIPVDVYNPEGGKPLITKKQ